MTKFWRWLFPEPIVERGFRVFPYEVAPLPERPSGGGDIPPAKVERKDCCGPGGSLFGWPGGRCAECGALHGTPHQGDCSHLSICGVSRHVGEIGCTKPGGHDGAHNSREIDVEAAALNLVRATNETEQNYWRAWLGFLLDGWPYPAKSVGNRAGFPSEGGRHG